MLRILHLPQTTSTMDVARQLVLQGDDTTDGVLADYQTNARGRLGRVWHTFPAPYSLAVTYIVRVPCAHLPLVTAWAMWQAVQETEAEGIAADIKIKWPNDILKNGLKIGGILCERINQEPDAPTLVGVGLNLKRPPDGISDFFPGDFLETMQNHEFYTKKIGACLFEVLDLYVVQGWAAFHDNYARACITFGQHITWKGPAGDTELTGLARGLNTSGHLEVVGNDGTVHVITSGDIVAQAIVKPV